ncbi:MAG: hypothetical protein DRH37_05960 [Deltaproteobacteria bacterium]|nr:MAG: hypothetical protein DRH37_05960 [Deltaproteobacteria bacterium]
MPGQDRTGPMGQGPRTGQGLGKCGKPKNSARGAKVPSGSGFSNSNGSAAGRGCGKGRGRGGGRGCKR